MYTARAFVAGIVAAAVACVAMLLVRSAGVPLDIPTRLAMMFGASGLVLGVLFYLVAGGLIALIYAVVFEWVLNQAGVGAGLLLGACNTIIAGFLWQGGSDPGRFWQHFGAAGMASLFFVHFVYGGVVGGLYKTKHHVL
jgi:hypothetical protein